jgi:hypothetical protein
LAKKKGSFYDRDMGYAKLMTAFQANKGERAVFVGFLRSSGVHKGSNMTVASIGAIHEFGSSDGKIPERSFMRSAVQANRKKLEEMIGKLSLAVIEGAKDSKTALGILGEYVKGLMQKKIRAGVPPPLSAGTVARKGSSVPLIDTGQLINSIEWQIVEGKK